MAALVTDWVLYMTPVKGVQEIMQAKADDTSMSAGDRKYYQTLATSPLLFPPDDLQAANLHPTPTFTPDQLHAMTPDAMLDALDLASLELTAPA